MSPTTTTATTATTAPTTKATEILKDIVRHPFAFPGGYEKAAVTSDGGVLCHKCLRSEFRTILHSTKYQYNDGWEVTGVLLVDEMDTSLTCDHCARYLNDDSEENK